MILKIEDRAGLLYANDKGGNLIEAKDAANGTPYFCPICDCSMHPATTPKGERYFARSAGTQHTNSVCITYEAIKKKHTFDGMDPYTFILSLCRVTPRRDTKRDNQLSSGGNDSNNIKDESSITTSNFSSLKQIDKELDAIDGSKMGNHNISDFVLTYKNAKSFFSGNAPLGARIVLCRFVRVDTKNHAFIFELFSKSAGLSAIFRLVIPKNSDAVYRDLKAKFITYKEAENGTGHYEKNHRVQDVFIACDNWEFLSQNQCRNVCNSIHCDNCKGMYQAVYTNSKQIYLRSPED